MFSPSTIAAIFGGTGAALFAQSIHNASQLPLSIDTVGNVGIVGALVAGFIWWIKNRTAKDEERMAKQDERHEAMMNRVVDVVKDTARAITEHTGAIRELRRELHSKPCIGHKDEDDTPYGIGQKK